MTSQDDCSELWRKNLEPDERVVWSGATSEELRLKEVGGRRQIGLMALIASLAVGVILGWNFMHPPPVEDCRPLNCSLVNGLASIDVTRVPSFLLGILACGAVAVFAFMKRLSETQPERIYALTSTRLLACDGQGRICDQLPVGNVAELRWKAGMAAPIIEVRRKQDAESRGSLIIRNVADTAGLEKALMSRRSPA